MLVLSREAGSILNLVKSDHIGVAIDRAIRCLRGMRTGNIGFSFAKRKKGTNV